MRLGKKIQLLLISSLITLASMPISPAFGAILKMADFETGDFSQFQNPTLLPNNVSAEGGSISVVTTRAYDGIYSAGASVPSGSGNKYARTIWELTSPWEEGTDVWYGMAIYLPVGFKSAMQSYYVPMRWDNYGSTANDSRGGISMWSDKRFRLFRLHAGVEDPEVSLTNSFDITEGAWHWLEVHQKFSTTDGLALNEVFVDDILVAQSTARNYYGYPITRLRNGIVALGNQTNALEMSMDRLTISSTRVGAGSNTVPPPVLNPVDTIAPTIPTNLRISAGLRSASLSWSSASDSGGSGLAGYEIYRRSSTQTTFTKVGSTTITSYKESLARGSYSYYVRAYDNAGNRSLPSATVTAKVR